MVMLEKVADRGFLAFWLFENEWKFRRSVQLPQKIWNLAKSEYYSPRHHWAAPLYSLCTAYHSISNTSTTTTTSISAKPWNVWTYHYHTSYYADHRFPIINTNHFVIDRCEFYLRVNLTWNSAMFTNHNQLITPLKKLQKNRWYSILIFRCMKKILLNFQWNPPTKTRKIAEQILKTSSCEISFWVLRHVSVAIVTNFKKLFNLIKVTNHGHKIIFILKTDKIT